MRIILSSLLTFSLVFQASIQAFADVNAQKESITRYLQSAGLNSSSHTYKDLDRFLSLHLPPQTYKIYEKDLKRMGTKKLPQFTVSNFKNSEGLNALKLIFSENGKTQTIEINPNEITSVKDNVVKLDGVQMSLLELLDPKKSSTKYFSKYPSKLKEAKSARIRPYVNEFNNPYAENSSFGGNFLIPSKEYWKSLAPEKKATFIVELRKLWIASQAVDRAFANKKTAANSAAVEELFASANSSLSFEKIEAVLRLIVKEAGAQAADLTRGRGPTDLKPNPAPAPTPATAAQKQEKPVEEIKPAPTQRTAPPTSVGGAANNTLLIATSSKGYCINRGLIGKGNSQSCRHPSTLPDNEIKNDALLIQQKKLALSANCPANERACNPNLFYSARGSICTSSGVADYGRKGTHFDGECEIGSTLFPPSNRYGAELENELKRNPGLISPEMMGDLEQSLLNKLRAKDAGMTNPDGSTNTAGLAEIKELTKQFIDQKGGFANDESFFNVVNMFYNDINQNLRVCKAMFAKQTVYDKAQKKQKNSKSVDASEQLGACQALLVRKLSFDIGLGQLCPQVFAENKRTNDELADINHTSNYSAKNGKSCLQAVVSPPTDSSKPVEVVDSPVITIDDSSGVNRSTAAANPPCGTPDTIGVTVKCTNEEESKFALSCGPYTIYCTLPLLGLALWALNKDDKKKKTTTTAINCAADRVQSGTYCVCKSGTTEVNGVCITSNSCGTGYTNVNGSCVCSGTNMIEEGGACIVGYPCPGTGTVVSTIVKCTEGSTGTTGGGSVGGVPTTQ